MTQTEKKGLKALAALAGRPSPPSDLTSGDGKSGKPIAQANNQVELLEFDTRNLPEWAEDFAKFLLLTGQSHVDVATKCLFLKHLCKKKFLQKHVKQIVKTCFTQAEVEKVYLPAKGLALVVIEGPKGITHVYLKSGST